MQSNTIYFHSNVSMCLNIDTHMKRNKQSEVGRCSFRKKSLWTLKIASSFKANDQSHHYMLFTFVSGFSLLTDWEATITRTIQTHINTNTLFSIWRFPVWVLTLYATYLQLHNAAFVNNYFHICFRNNVIAVLKTATAAVLKPEAASSSAHGLESLR